MRRTKEIKALTMCFFYTGMHHIVASTTLPPRSFASIASQPDRSAWYTAYQDEITSIKTTREMTVVERPKDAEVVSITAARKTKQKSLKRSLSQSLS